MMNELKIQTRLSWVPVSFYMNFLYCFGASIMDSFVIYPGWKLLTAAEFVHFHQEQSQWIINAFVIPLAITTVFNVLMFWVKPLTISKRLTAMSLGCMAVNWTLSFTIQIPMHRQLNIAYNPTLLHHLLLTNYIRVALQVLQIVVVYRMMTRTYSISTA
jgi:hypothetical protein